MDKRIGQHGRIDYPYVNVDLGHFGSRSRFFKSKIIFRSLHNPPEKLGTWRGQGSITGKFKDISSTKATDQQVTHQERVHDTQSKE